MRPERSVTWSTSGYVSGSVIISNATLAICAAENCICAIGRIAPLTSFLQDTDGISPQRQLFLDPAGNAELQLLQPPAGGCDTQIKALLICLFMSLIPRLQRPDRGIGKWHLGAS